MRGLLKKFRDGFKRQTPTLHKAFEGVFTGARLDPAALGQLEETLFAADFGVETVEEILGEIEAAHKADKSLRGEGAARIGAEVLTRALEGAEGRLEPGARKPEVICLVGVNGSGKTTTAAKLGHLYQKEGYGVLLGACDTFRAAANEQIRSWAERLGVDLVSSQHGADAAATAFDSHEAAAARGRDLLILDTAGRLHTKGNLMKELEKLCRVLAKRDPSAPHHSWLVVDGSLGCNSVEQARVFNESFPLTGLVVTKLDGTSRGGALVPIYRELKLPIYFVGLGEQPDDLQPFSARDYAEAIFGVEQEEEAAR
jgi:fused signal recognition particle receptor